LDKAAISQTVWDTPGEEWLQRLQASREGLSTTEARRRLQVDGPNELPGERRTALLLELLSFFTNPLVLILLLASVVAAAFGEVANAGIIAAIVVISIVLNFVQAYRSHRAAEELKQSVATTASVRRDEKIEEIPLREVVPGDVFLLSAGSIVPADAILLEADDLHVNEAPLTGESLPREKRAGPLPPGSHPLAEADNAVFLGTTVVSGSGVAVAVRTGAATEFGQIARHLAVRPPESEFERGMRQFGLLIMRTVLFLVLFVFLVNALGRRDPLEALLFSLALAVGLTPEFLPMIISVTLAQGAVRMARRRVIVKQLAAIENFGSMDVLCTDKTGTLTEGHIILDHHLDLHGKPSERVLELASLNSAFQTGLRSPLDEAILRRVPAERVMHPSESGYRKIDEMPFDFFRRRLSVVVEGPEGRLLITKGAPESLIPLCPHFEADGQCRKMDDAARAELENCFQELCREGYRVLALGYRRMEAQPAYRVEDEKELVFAGLLAFLDPPRSDVRETLMALQRDGIRIKILTGDNELVAGKICADVGLDGKSVVLGSDLERMSDSALQVVADEATVFARVSPDQKNRILHALKRRGHVVGYLGDGINDAPSLRTADVGISVAGAVDVAKEAADLILLEPSLAALHEGVMEGRKSFGNILKYVLMGTSSNFGNMFSMAGASLLLPFLPLLPGQILLNNLLYDLSQVTIPTDNVDAAFVRKPRRWDLHFIRQFMVMAGPVSSLYDFLTFALMLKVFHAGAELFRTGWFVESLATQSLVIFVLRTAGSPLRSRPSAALLASVLLLVTIGVWLPFTPLARYLGFVPLPAPFFLFLVLMVVTYLVLVDGVKRWIYRRYAL
jgi:Mg2+-importing ATPase